MARYRYRYAKLLRLYSKPYYERFGEGMEQTFNDLLRERTEEERGLFGCALWMFVETSVGIIRENITLIIMQNKNIVRIALVTACILLVPLVAMQFTEEVNWDLFDFAFMGALLFGTGLTYELVARKGGSIAYRVAVGLALATAFVLVWMNGAVGIIWDENIPANMMYAGVLVVGFIGALIARFQPHGMARTLFAMAIALALVPVVALMFWKPQVSLGVFVLNTFFVMLFVGSALLFRRAARKRNGPGVEPTA